MSLTLQSLAAAAKRKAKRAQKHVEAAEADLKVANEKLEQAIPLGDSEEIKVAHEKTQQAEKAVADASHDLEVVGELLDDPHDLGAHAPATGEGADSLLRNLKTQRKPTE
jgi:hypothetical protein